MDIKKLLIMGLIGLSAHSYGSDTNAAKSQTEHKRLFFDAAEHGQYETVERLLKSGNIDVNAKNKYGYPAIMLAAMQGHLNIVTLLLKYKADVNSSNNSDDVALDEAMLNHHHEIAKLLLKNGATTNIDQFIENAFKEENAYELIKFLLNHYPPGGLSNYDINLALEYATSLPIFKMLIFYINIYLPYKNRCIQLTSSTDSSNLNTDMDSLTIDRNASFSDIWNNEELVKQLKKEYWEKIKKESQQS